MVLELERPDAHPARELELSADRDVLRCGLRLWEVREQVCDRGVCEVFEWRRDERPI